MYVKYIFPIKIFIYSKTQEHLTSLSAVTFRFSNLLIQVSLPGGVVQHSEISDNLVFFRQTEGIQIILNDEGPDHTQIHYLNSLTRSESHTELFQLAIRISNKVCRIIRNFGMTYGIPEIIAENKFNLTETDNYLFKWSFQMSSDGINWTSIISPQRADFDIGSMVYQLLFSDRESPKTAYLNVNNWPCILEAFEENKEPFPEHEFYVNTLEHLDQRNYRLAILEAIICLEIVITEYLQKYLSISKNIPQNRIHNFLKPDLGLTARVSAMLDLTIHESYLNDIDLDKVTTVIRWRNKIIHGTGHLPENVEDNTFINRINEVLSLIDILAERRDNIIASPDLNTIAEILKLGFDQIFLSSIWLKNNHRIRIDFPILLSPTQEVSIYLLENIANAAAFLCSERDSRFNAEDHLAIKFYLLPSRKTIGWFVNGMFHKEE